MWRVKTVTKFKNSFFPDLIYWNDIENHLGFQHSYLVPPLLGAGMIGMLMLKMLMMTILTSPQVIVPEEKNCMLLGVAMLGMLML